jgi:MFS family permease
VTGPGFAPDPEPVLEADAPSAAAVFRNSAFLRLWLAQAATQIGGNMVLYGLTVIVVGSTSSNTPVSLLIVSFLVPAVLFSAVAGVYVDRLDRRVILVLTNFLRGVALIGLYLVGDNLAAILILNIFVSTLTTFFAPAEAAMIPAIVERKLLLAANGVFTLTLNAAFALGFALLGPLVVSVAGAEALILIVGGLYFIAALFCFTLPASPPPERDVAVGDAGAAAGETVAQLREGIGFIQGHRGITWSLVYLGIAASLVGVLGVLGPEFARESLGLTSKDFVVVVLPLGFGVVTGVLLLNSYGRYVHRRRVIEGGLIFLGLMLAALSGAGPISRILQNTDGPGGFDLSAITSLLAVVVVIALLAGIAYAFVAIPSQTQLQEDLPEDVRGRVFGILNMLVSVSSFLPIIIAGAISDLIGTTSVILIVAVATFVTGVASFTLRGPLLETDAQADPHAVDPIAAALGADRPTWHDAPTTRSTVPAPAIDPPAASGPEPDASPLEHAGPADPTDRD